MRRGYRKLLKDTLVYMIKNDKGEYGIREIAKGVGSTWRTTKGVLETLLDLELVEVVKVGKRTKWRHIARAQG